MSDDELDRTVKNCIGENQRIGPNAVKARLFSQDINVQRWRVRDSMMRVDEGGIALRAAMTIQRRTYAVAGPNSVWHIDDTTIKCFHYWQNVVNISMTRGMH